MAAGETYTVPADAQNPQILTGRPQALRVTIGGKEVAPLGPADRTITDVGISAAALNASPAPAAPAGTQQQDGRSEEHTSELQSLMRISYAVFCLKKKKQHTTAQKHHEQTNIH